jgi:hypothetical protein
LSEARHLQRAPSETLPWVDVEAGRVWLPAVVVKSDEDQWVPLHPKLREARLKLPDAGPAFFDFRSRKGGRAAVPERDHQPGDLHGAAGRREAVDALSAEGVRLPGRGAACGTARCKSRWTTTPAWMTF